MLPIELFPSESVGIEKAGEKRLRMSTHVASRWVGQDGLDKQKDSPALARRGIREMRVALPAQSIVVSD